MDIAVRIDRVKAEIATFSETIASDNSARMMLIEKFSAKHVDQPKVAKVPVAAPAVQAPVRKESVHSPTSYASSAASAPTVSTIGDYVEVKKHRAPSKSSKVVNTRELKDELRDVDVFCLYIFNDSNDLQVKWKSGAKQGKHMVLITWNDVLAALRHLSDQLEADGVDNQRYWYYATADYLRKNEDGEIELSPSKLNGYIQFEKKGDKTSIYFDSRSGTTSNFAHTLLSATQQLFHYAMIARNMTVRGFFSKLNLEEPYVELDEKTLEPIEKK